MSPALATSCPFRNNIEAHNGTDNRGVRATDPAGIAVYTGGAPCARISSIAVVDAATQESAEGGWVDSNNVQGPDRCAAADDGSPHFFWAYVDKSGYEYCDWNHTNLGSTDIRVKINDPDLTGTFSYYLDGTYEGAYFTDFTTGDPVTNSERHGSSDDATADFQDLEYEYGLDWEPWNNTTCYLNDDPTYYLHIPSDSHVTVNTTSSSC